MAAVCAQGLVAFLLCSFAHAVMVPAQNAGRLGSLPQKEVSMLQSSFNVQASSAWQARLNKDVPTVVIDLDAAPEDRWKNATAHWVKLGAYPVNLNVTPPRNGSREGKIVRAMMAEVDDEYLREMKGIIADLGLPERMVSRLLLNNLGYELFRVGGCSGVLAAMPNGTVVHGRNMDYMGTYQTEDGRALQLPDVLIQVLWMRGGKPLFTSVQWPGFTGIHTAMRFGSWSFEQNTRSHTVPLSYQHGLKYGPRGFLLSARKIMETTPDFEAAVEKLRRLDLMAPSYFIVAGAGPYQGAVITMDRGAGQTGAMPVTWLSTNRSSMRHSSVYTDWGVVQTNDDLDKKPLDKRRPNEELRLAQSTQELVSPSWVFSEMTGGALYVGSTVFTSVFVPATGYVKVAAHPENVPQ